MRILPKKPQLTASELVTQEAANVEDALLIEAISDSVRKHLPSTLLFESIWFDRAANSYRVKITGAGETSAGKRITTSFEGSIPEEHVREKAVDTTTWNTYIEQCIDSWVYRVARTLRERGGLRMISAKTSSKSTDEIRLSADKLAKSFLGFKERTEQLEQTLIGIGRKNALRYGEGPTRAEMKAVENSLKQSAERRAEHRASRRKT